MRVGTGAYGALRIQNDEINSSWIGLCAVSEFWWKLCSPQVLACYWAGIEFYSQCQFDKFYENCIYVWIFISHFRKCFVSFLGVQIPKLLEPYCVPVVFLFVFIIFFIFVLFFCPKSVPSMYSYSQNHIFLKLSGAIIRYGLWFGSYLFNYKRLEFFPLKSLSQGLQNISEFCHFFKLVLGCWSNLNTILCNF